METKRQYLFEYGEVKFKDKFLFPKGKLNIPLNNISLIIGKNGTGKSTLLKQIQYKYKSCLYVAQQPEQILKEFTVLENLTMSQDNISEEYVVSVLETLNLTKLLEHKSCELSGGEKKIVSILRAIFSNNPILLMDEPTNDLDYRSVNSIIEILKVFQKQRTVIIVTHDERLFELATAMFIIENNEIRQVKASFTEKAELPPDGKNCLKNNVLLKRIFRQDAGRIFCIFLLCIICFINVLKFASILSKEIRPISDNQVNFCNSLYDTTFNLLFDGYLPTSFLGFIRNDTNVWQLKGELEDVLKKTELLPYNLNLSLPENEDVKYYELLFYCPSLNTIVSVFDYIKSNESETVVGDFFILTGVLEEYNNLPFSDSIYSSAISNIQKDYADEKLELVFCVALLNSEKINFFDYVSDEYFGENLNANYYVCSNEIIALLQSAIQINEIQYAGKWGLVFLGVASILMIFNTSLVNMLRKKQSEILRDYGFAFTDIEHSLCSVYQNKWSVFVGFIVVLFNIVIAVAIKKANIFLIYTPALITILVLVLTNRIEQIISKKYHKKVFMFGGVFNDI